jgi:hypothetical protein
MASRMRSDEEKGSLLRSSVNRNPKLDKLETGKIERSAEALRMQRIHIFPNHKISIISTIGG